jgi:ABC-type antimicrobial peptide transport system permease subunit
MRAYPFRALSLALTLSLGVSLVASIMIWSDTGIHVSVNEYFDENAFQMVIQNPVGETEDVDYAERYVESSPLIEGVHRVASTIGLVWGTQLPDSTLYGTEESMYTQGIKDCEVIFVTQEFLDVARSEFEFEGSFGLQEGEILVSKQFIAQVYEIYDVTLTINSTIDMELLTRSSESAIDTIGLMGRESLTSLRIAGIYQVKGLDTLFERAFPSILRQNYAHINYRTPVLGIHDSVMVLPGSLSLNLLSELGFFGAKSFVRASGDALIEAGVDKIAENLFTLKARVDEQFDVIVYGADKILYLQGLVNTYQETMPLTLLNLPIFILALFLSVFAADTFMTARATEVSALRSKGASSSQIYGMFLAESIIMAFLSVVLGLTLSILFAALIPSATSFLVFDWTLYIYFLTNTVLYSRTIINTILLCIAPPLIFILYSARKTANTEIGANLIETSDPISSEPPAYGTPIGASIFLLVLVLLTVIFLPKDPAMLMIQLSLGTAAWFFLAYNGSRVSRVGFSKLSEKITFLLGEKNLISAGNLRMRKGRIVPLMIVLTLTLSSAITFTVEAESFRVELEREVQYAVGADLRIDCIEKPFDFNSTLETFPGVERAIPVFRTRGAVGMEHITIEALDPIEYSLIGHFDESSFFGLDSASMLKTLADTRNGIILSEYHANRWNKTIGDSLNLQIASGGRTMDAVFIIVGLVYSSPGFGYASITYIPASRLGAGFGFQAAESGFALANLDYVAEVIEGATANLFMADLVCITDHELLLRALADIPGVTATMPEEFDLESISFGTALFLNTVQGLFSIGFAMSFLLSMFGHTLFLGSIVRERKRDYAILRAVGGSKRQIVNVVLSEFSGVVFASLTLSLLLGTIFGYIMSTIIFIMSPFSRLLEAVVTFPIPFLTSILLIEVIAMIGATIFPAREASKTDPAIVLRNL